MRVQNVRLGHACNSSSTHSVILLPTENDRGVMRGDRALSFLMGAITDCLEDAVGRDMALQIAAALCTPYMSDPTAACRDDMTRDIPADMYDNLSLPRPHLGATCAEQSLICSEFLDDMARFLTRDDIGVRRHYNFRGPDPVKKEDFLLPNSYFSSSPYGFNTFDESWGGRGLQSHNPIVCRKDHDSWVLFNQWTGAKVRLTLGDFEVGRLRDEIVAGWNDPDKGRPPVALVDAVSPRRPDSPELVDVKITDFCPYGCEYCYQGSTTDGEHASPHALEAIARNLGEMKVFEVAIGGGEPTLHPYFIPFLQALSWRDIVPNFTTRNLSWIRKDEGKKIIDLVGGFAYSVDTVEDVERLGGAIRRAKEEDFANGNRVHMSAQIQVVERVMPEETFKAILRRGQEIGVDVTILGYKEVGRGADFTPPHDWDWLECIQDPDMKLRRIGIDTVLAERDGARLTAQGLSGKFLTTREGEYSMYIDAVQGRSAPSSFCTDDEYEPLDLDDDLEMRDQIQDHFGRMG